MGFSMRAGGGGKASPVAPVDRLVEADHECGLVESSRTKYLIKL